MSKAKKFALKERKVTKKSCCNEALKQYNLGDLKFADNNGDNKIDVNVRCKDKKKPLPRYICGKAAIFEEKLNVS